MPDILQKSAQWLEDMRQAHRTVPVTYTRDSESVQVPATIGRTVFHFARDYGAFERHESRDFLVSASDLVISGAEVMPGRGDTIRETSSNKVYTYEVMAPANEPCWRWSDDYRRVLRIHTKLVNTEEI